jgi:TPR repeat protein
MRPLDEIALYLRLTSLFLASALACAGIHMQAQASGIDATLLAKANSGNASAQVQVGEAYETGKGVARDPNQAAAWYRKAADQKSISAELHLARLYRDGGGKDLSRDVEQSADWYRKAAD